MKDKEDRVVSAPAEPSVGSPSVNGHGINISDLYMDMLCERYKNRGIKTGFTDPQRQKKIEKCAMQLGLNAQDEQERRARHKTLKLDGILYMSLDDFAEYYRETRKNKFPVLRSDAEIDRGGKRDGAKAVQGSGNAPKKAKRLAVIKSIKKCLGGFLESFIFNEIRNRDSEKLREKEGKKLPRRAFAAVAAVAVSLFLVVCSSVMVSRATTAVGRLDREVDMLTDEKKELGALLDVKNNMLDIKKTAVDEYGMISGEYAASRYLDISPEEKIENVKDEKEDASLISVLLSAMGWRE